MASIHKEVSLRACPDETWAAVRDVGRVHEKLCPGVLTGARLDGDSRVVTFASGSVIRERIVAIDDGLRRVAYAVTDWVATHHNASMQVVADGEDRCRIVWVADVLPDDLAAPMAALMDQGIAAMRNVLEKGAAANIS